MKVSLNLLILLHRDQREVPSETVTLGVARGTSFLIRLQNSLIINIPGINQLISSEILIEIFFALKKS